MEHTVDTWDPGTASVWETSREETLADDTGVQRGMLLK